MSRVNEAPLSEDSSKFHPRATRQQCIDDLIRVQNENPGKIATRDIYRREGKYSEATWDRLFGTFREFRRQAGLILSRQQHAHERHIARHASVDHYREMNEEKADWGDKYIRENKKRYQTILGIADIHDKSVDPFWLRVVLDTAKRVQPDVICINGDLFDLPEFGKYDVDPREYSVVDRIKFVHNEVLKPLRENCPEAQIDLIEGNHEARLLKHLKDATPAMRVVLSDLHGWEIKDLFQLPKFEINYVSASDLAAWTTSDTRKEITKNFKIYYDCVLAHHEPVGRQLGYPGFNGHNHKHIVWPNYSPQFGSFEWHQIGCGHIRNATYCEGLKWANGFVIINVDTHHKLTNFDYIPITNTAISGGKWYYRTKSEEVMSGWK